MAATRTVPKRGASSAPKVSWREASPAAIVLISGPEEVCAERATAQIRAQLRSLDPNLEVSDLRADDYSPGDLLAVASPSLFGEPRLVRISGVERCNDTFLAEALAYLGSVQEGATVIFRHTAASVRGKKLLDAIRAEAESAIEIPVPAISRDADRNDFAAAEFRSAGRKIAPTAMRALVLAFADDVTELAAACQQLISDTDGEISLDVVERYYGGRVEVGAFAVVDTALAGNYPQAIAALRHAFSSGVDPVPLVAAFAMKLRSMARVAGATGSAREVAAKWSMKDWQVDRARRDLRGWDEASLGYAIVSTARADAEVKGQSRDPHFALERLVAIVANRQKAE